MKVYVAATEFNETIIGVFSSAESAWNSSDFYGNAESVTEYEIDDSSSWKDIPR